MPCIDICNLEIVTLQPDDTVVQACKVMREFHVGAVVVTKKLWDYIKANKLQTKTVNGSAMDAGKYIVCDAHLHPIFKNTKSTSKSGKLTDLTNIKVGETVDMMQMAAIVGANIA